tara:strand:- start:173 stop:1120 length:948 start_codon:yes stop_codon:yes gene_type:complete
MKLTKTQAEKICNSYSLGEFKSVKPIREGWVNHNFTLTTEKGKFIVQVFSSGFDKWKQGRMKLQIKVLRHLKKKNFPYETPDPIKNNKGDYVLKLGKNHLWVYKRIEGKTKKRIDEKEFREIARLLAEYHKYTKELEAKEKDFSEFINWQFKKYQKLGKVKAKDRVDRVMLKNLDFYEDILRKIKKIDFGKNWIVTHSDIHNGNLLYKNDKIVGLIDFDLIGSGPRVKDIIMSIDRCDFLPGRTSDKKIKIFLNEYEKEIPLSKKEKDLIIPYLLLDYCNLFWWFYEGMEKNQNKRYEEIVGITKRAKLLAKGLR